MSKHNNVNPNFYNDGGREHTEGPDKGDSQYEPKDRMSQSRQANEGQPGSPNFIPGEAAIGESGKTKSQKK